MVVRRIDGFLIGSRGCCDNIITYYNCSGEVICETGGVDGIMCEKYDIIKEEVIYTHSTMPLNQ
jgi:hypothetical protein